MKLLHEFARSLNLQIDIILKHEIISKLELFKMELREINVPKIEIRLHIAT